LGLGGKLRLQLLKLLRENGILWLDGHRLVLPLGHAGLAIGIQHSLGRLSNHHWVWNDLNTGLLEVFGEGILIVRRCGHAESNDHRRQRNSGQERSERGLA
jgi:hypothetical protein